MNLFARWLAAAGVTVPTDAAGNAAAELEIDPLCALDAGELRRRVRPGLDVGRRLHLKA
jgi:UDP-N-acetylglucosamine/UDP-N-acetylgalactosamine diphosphorylase